MTFEELNDSIGAEAIYSGTSVDAATQAALLEWNFDRFLSMEGEDTTNWLRKYRRNLNMFYPIYLDRLRVESVRSNMDPFITEFMEKVHDDNGTVTKAGSSVKNGSKGGSDTEQTVTDNTQVRTPDLTTTGSNSTQGSSSTSGSDASRQLSESSGQAHGESEDNGKARGMQNIIDLLHSQDIKRIRIGIGEPSFNAVDYVLGKPLKEELPLVEESIIRAVEALKEALKSNFEKAMSQYN